MEKIKGNEIARGAESRTAQKVMELEAGRVLVDQAAKRVEEEREKLEEERQETKEQESGRSSRDTPELSPQSRWFGLEGKLLEEEQQKWILEMEEELWEALNSWNPVPYADLERQLKELSELYLKLLNAVLTCTTGENQAIQKERLDGVLTEKLQMLAEVKLGNLLSLLGETGETELLKHVWNSLYKQTAGEYIPMKTVERLLESGFKAAGRNTGTAGQTGQTGQTGRTIPVHRELSASMEEGSVYKPSGKNRVRMSAEFDIHRKAEAAVSLTSKAGRVSGQGVYTAEELERAEVFAAHLRESRSLFNGIIGIEGAGASGEAAGYYAAVTSIKGQVYGSSPQEHAFPMESLVNRMVDYYLSRKGAYRVYHYTMEEYERTKSPESAAKKGLEYAYRMFCEKKSGTGENQQKQGGGQPGFFAMFSGETAEEAYKKALGFLEKNWREFLQVMGEEGRDLTLRMQHYSPWAAMAEAAQKRQGQGKRENRILLRQMLVIAGAVFLYFVWKFFFS